MKSKIKKVSDWTAANAPSQERTSEPGAFFSDVAEKAVTASAIVQNRFLRGVLAPLGSGADFYFYGQRCRAAWRAILEFDTEGQSFDEWLLVEKLAGGSPEKLQEWAAFTGDAMAYQTDDAGILKRHVSTILEFAKQRRTRAFAERLAKDAEAGLNTDELFARMSGFLDDIKAGRRGEVLFHTYEEIVNAPPASFAIEGYLPEDGITLIGAPPANAKTFVMLAMVRALFEGGKLFHHFPVNRISSRVIYLCPESGLSSFAHRLRLFHLLDYVREEKLLCRTLSAGRLSLTDPRLREAVRGSDVFLDTAIRFMEGDENSNGEQREFAELLFELQRAGARTITGAHHSPKSFAKDSHMGLENILRGSGDLGAMLVACWGLSQIDSTTNRVFVQNVKARDFLPCEPFIIQGRPSIDESGYFQLTEPPGFAGCYADHKNKAGRPEMPDKDAKRARARELKEQGMSVRDIAEELGVSRGSVGRWTL